MAPRPGEQQVVVSEAEAILHALVCHLRGEPSCQEAVAHSGWDYGIAAYMAGTSLHAMLKEVDLLTSMVLYACERAVSELSGEREAAGQPGPEAADAMGIARRLHLASSLLRLAAAKGFTHDYLGDLQEHYRTLRHDLRNPLGTIKSAVSLMEDESIPAELRDSPRYRAMVTRNAKNIDSLIGDNLSDASAQVPAFARQEVSLEQIACAVRRDLRAEAEAADCRIEVIGSLPPVVADSTHFELVLKSVIAAALGAARRGTAIVVRLRAVYERHALVEVSYTPAQERGDGGLIGMGALAFAQEMLTGSGGRVHGEGSTICLDVPVSLPPGGPVASANPDVQAGQDVVRAN
ncbi:MAG TPA: histidine kinase dimerization/phospho-acceptor domain-containing protein [Gemmatimonadaceae bacterium]|nr:histidine kinase dimerization/phospho-acceptor domain-containing protein [Gemmatimonadaceae bacterium]